MKNVPVLSDKNALFHASLFLHCQIYQLKDIICTYPLLYITIKQPSDHLSRYRRAVWFQTPVHQAGQHMI